METRVQSAYISTPEQTHKCTQTHERASHTYTQTHKELHHRLIKCGPSVQRGRQEGTAGYRTRTGRGFKTQGREGESHTHKHTHTHTHTHFPPACTSN